jgi:hypothetical protein
MNTASWLTIAWGDTARTPPDDCPTGSVGTGWNGSRRRRR